MSLLNALLRPIKVATSLLSKNEDDQSVRWFTRHGSSMPILLQFESPDDHVVVQIRNAVSEMTLWKDQIPRNDSPTISGDIEIIMDRIVTRLYEDYRENSVDPPPNGFYYAVGRDRSDELYVMTRLPTSRDRDANTISYGMHIIRPYENEYVFWKE